MDHLFVKNSVVDDWLSKKGYIGTPDDKWITYIQSGSPITNGTVDDHLARRLMDAGYGPGTMYDMLTTMFQSKTGISNRKDAERAFFDDSSLDFFSSGLASLLDDAGFVITDDSGNIITA